MFVPISPGEKGTRRPRTPGNLYAADDPVLKAYLETGHNYGITCRGDLAAAVVKREMDMAGLDETPIDLIAIELHHCHLPKMESLGVIDYEQDCNRVVSGP